MTSNDAGPKTTVEKGDIQRRYLALKTADRDERHAALRAVSEKTEPLFAALHKECETAGGHEMQPDYGRARHWITGALSVRCEFCGKTEWSKEE